MAKLPEVAVLAKGMSKTVALATTVYCSMTRKRKERDKTTHQHNSPSK